MSFLCFLLELLMIDASTSLKFTGIKKIFAKFSVSHSSYSRFSIKLFSFLPFSLKLESEIIFFPSLNFGIFASGFATVIRTFLTLNYLLSHIFIFKNDILHVIGFIIIFVNFYNILHKKHDLVRVVATAFFLIKFINKKLTICTSKKQRMKIYKELCKFWSYILRQINKFFCCYSCESHLKAMNFSSF